MRIAIGLIFLIIATTADAQSTLPGFMGIKFGTSLKDAKAAMLSKDGVVFDAVNSDSNTLEFENVKWGAYTPPLTLIEGDDSLGMCRAEVFLKPEEPYIFRYYEGLLGALQEKYGKPTISTRHFTAPYELGDGRELEAIESGKGVIQDVWDFSDQNDLLIWIDEKDFIEVGYESSNLLDKERKRIQKKYSGDY